MNKEQELTNQLHRLVYISQIQFPIEDIDSVLNDIQHQARARNYADHISGVLCYHDGYFFQYVEGTHDALSTLKHKLDNDDRHHNICYLSFDSVPYRRFHSWEMRFIVTRDLPISTTQVTHFDRLTPFERMPENPLIWENFIESLVSFEKTLSTNSHCLRLLVSKLSMKMKQLPFIH